MAELEDLIRERIKQELGMRDQSRSNVLNELAQMRQIFGQPSQPGVFQAMGGGIQQDQSPMENEMTPEDYEYFVEIQKRDLLNEEGKAIGWDKSVRRFRTPTAADLTDEGFESEDKKKKKNRTIGDLLNETQY